MTTTDARKRAAENRPTHGGYPDQRPVQDEATRASVELSETEAKQLFDAIHDPTERGVRDVHERVFAVVRSIVAAARAEFDREDAHHRETLDRLDAADAEAEQLRDLMSAYRAAWGGAMPQLWRDAFSALGALPMEDTQAAFDLAERLANAAKECGQ